MFSMHYILFLNVIIVILLLLLELLLKIKKSILL